MKRLYLLLFLFILLKLPGFAQTVIWDEEFIVTPAGWEFEGNWGAENDELLLYYYPITENYDFTAESLEIDVPANGGELTINQFVDVYLSYVTNEITEIVVINGEEEDVIWSHELINGVWGTYGGEEISFDMEPYAGETVQLKFRSYGATTGSLWGWYIYSINLTSTFDHELAAMEIEGPKNLFPNVNGTWQVDVKNVGLEAENSFLIKVYSYKEIEDVATVEFDQTIEPGETVSIDFNWSSDVLHNTCLYAEIVSGTDEYPANNHTKDHFIRIEPEFDYSVLLWDNDNGIETIFNPQTGVKEQASQFLVMALYNAGIQFETVQSLPNDISGYDLIITTMGTYCLS
ncbi:MAG: hypothetical protein B6D64_01870 [Bacteroidetes bacterium 4484_276]|nr:MAG: hypothetical protein B6D64_01870 [Bacteroidetes bacterium 4484_276]OYT13827.1 MAG: hypothetical protein B6I19_03045 [Bacteroidetes bacterium 4572_114]